MTSGGVVLSPILTPVSSVCSPELLTKEDLFLLYAQHFFPWEINPGGLSHVYGVYDAAAGETSNMCLGIDDRQALMRSLWLAYQRMAVAMRYFPLPTYVNGERRQLNGSSAVHASYGYLTRVAERACVEVETDAELAEADDGLWEIDVTMPSSALIEDLVAYETGTREVRVPIAERVLSDDGLTATLRFYRPSLVKASVWAACTSARTPCDCSVNVATVASFMESVDVYHISPESGTGVDTVKTCSCTPTTASGCGSIENQILGLVRSVTAATSCSCYSANKAVYGTLYYTSGRWTVDTIPDDVLEGLFGMAISLMPEASMCQESTRPAHMRNYRELVPADAPGGMRSLGQVMMRAAVRTYANGSGV